jgi:Tol biopolymer transport system component
MNEDGSEQTQLTDNDVDDESPSWSPDGEKIAFESDRDGPVEIYVMDADGSDVTRLTNSANNDLFNINPSWSPDGEKIAFESNRDGNHEIYTMDADDGSDVTRLTDNDAEYSNPDWGTNTSSPDGDGKKDKKHDHKDKNHDR